MPVTLAAIRAACPMVTPAILVDSRLIPRCRLRVGSEGIQEYMGTSLWCLSKVECGWNWWVFILGVKSGTVR